MKIIFLDIDGVLNSEQYYKTVNRKIKGWARFDPQAVEYIKKLVDKFSAKIVISSTWRFGAIILLKDELNKSGLIKYLHKDWKTPELYPPHRGKEIKMWLAGHSEIIEYVIIDDDENIIGELKKRLVKTEVINGMTDEHYYKAEKMLSTNL